MKKLIITCLIGGLTLFGCAHNETDGAEGSLPEINQAQDIGATSPDAAPVSEKPIVTDPVAADSNPDVPPAPVKKIAHKKKHKKHAKKHAHHKKHKKHVVKKDDAASPDVTPSAQ